jgi:hypothetical protein
MPTVAIHAPLNSRLGFWAWVVIMNRLRIKQVKNCFIVLILNLGKLKINQNKTTRQGIAVVRFTLDKRFL